MNKSDNNLKQVQMSKSKFDILYFYMFFIDNWHFLHHFYFYLIKDARDPVFFSLIFLAADERK